MAMRILTKERPGRTAACTFLLLLSCGTAQPADPELDALARAAAASNVAVDAEPTLAYAYALCDRGDSASAIAAISEALGRNAARNATPAVATLVYARGQLHCESGDAALALPDLERALALFRTSSEIDPGLRLDCAMALAAAFVDVGELAQAATSLDELLADAEAATWGNRWLAHANLSDLRRRTGAHDSAITAARSALAELPEEASTADVAFAGAGLARALDAAAAAAGVADDPRRREAEQLLRDALARLDSEAESSASTAGLRLLLTQNLCSCLFHRGALDEALPLSHAIVAALPADSTRPEAVRILFSHASVLASNGDLATARTNLARAVELAAAQLAGAAASGSDRALFARHLELRSLLSSVLSCRTSFAPEPATDAADLDAVLAVRGLSEWRARRTHRLADAAAKDPDVAAAFVALQGSAAPSSTSTIEAARLRAEFDARQSALLRRCAASDDADLGGVARAARFLPKGSVLIATQTYERVPMAQRGRTTARGEDHVAAFLLRTDTTVQRFELGPADALRRRAEHFRTMLRSGREEVRGRAPGRPAAAGSDAEKDLSALLSPLLAAAGTGAETFVICSDDALAGVPWAALRLADGRRVLDAHEVHYADHPAHLAAGRGGDRRTALLALGDVEFGAKDPRFRALPGSARELEVCERLFAAHRQDARCRVLRARDADFATFANEARSAGYVHLSTHGWLLDRELWPSAPDPRFPAGLAVADDPLAQLSIAFACGDDGTTSLVEASRFATLDLTGCQLAVLACCDSNDGPRAFGDALSGLTAATRAAGVRSVVGALWPIPDDASARFLASFYEACWRDGASPGTALLRAQRDAIAAGVPSSCWAAFVHYGPIDAAR